MRAILRVLMLLIGAGLLAYGGLAERHEVYLMRADAATQPAFLDGQAFVEGTTVDAYLRQDGRLYDVYSLSPGRVLEKDCKS